MKAVYRYWYAACWYFKGKTVDLSKLTGDYEAQNYNVLTGTLSGSRKITVADGAEIVLKDANITSLSNSAEYAGITPLGDAAIFLEGTNTVKGGNENYPGIYAPVNHTLTIGGDGSLDASSNGWACGIGGGLRLGAGNIVINGGTITAEGGSVSAGIGSGGNDSTCGNITINGGTVSAKGGDYSAGIGSGYKTSCGDIFISASANVTVDKGIEAPNDIGAGEEGTCGTVTIEDGANIIYK